MSDPLETVSHEEQQTTTDEGVAVSQEEETLTSTQDAADLPITEEKIEAHDTQHQVDEEEKKGEQEANEQEQEGGLPKEADIQEEKNDAEDVDTPQEPENKEKAGKEEEQQEVDQETKEIETEEREQAKESQHVPVPVSQHHAEKKELPHLVHFDYTSYGVPVPAEEEITSVSFSVKDEAENPNEMAKEKEEKDRKDLEEEIETMNDEEGGADKILILTTGTRGDVQPFLAFGTFFPPPPQHVRNYCNLSFILISALFSRSYFSATLILFNPFPQSTWIVEGRLRSRFSNAWGFGELCRREWVSWSCFLSSRFRSRQGSDIRGI